MEIETDTQNPSEFTEGSSAPEAPTSADLDAYSEFLFQGNKYTPEKLSDLIKEHNEMSGLTSSYNQEAKYYHNLAVDLKAVKEDPSLAEKFRSVYPQKFHAFLDYASPSAKPAAQAQQSSNGLSKEYLDKINQMEQKIQAYEQETYQSKVQAAQAEIDTTLGKLKEKYPNADEDVILARAESMIQNGRKVTAGTWERLAKESHEKFVKNSDAYHKSILDKQLKKGQRGADMGAGGSLGQEGPPKRMTFAEATEAAIARLKGK